MTNVKQKENKKKKAKKKKNTTVHHFHNVQFEVKKEKRMREKRVPEARVFRVPLHEQRTTPLGHGDVWSLRR